MDNLRTEGYIRQVEHACLQERPRAALEICLVAREASRANPGPTAEPKPPAVGHGKGATGRRGKGQWPRRSWLSRLGIATLLGLALLVGAHAVIHAQPFVDPP